MNRLLTLYHQLDRDALECLELTWRFQGQVMSVSEFHLNRLLQMELLQFRYSQGWQLNWWGLAVLNWHRQLREAKNRKTLPAKPRGGENGFHLGPPCEKFRVLLFSVSTAGVGGCVATTLIRPRKRLHNSCVTASATRSWPIPGPVSPGVAFAS